MNSKDGLITNDENKEHSQRADINLYLSLMESINTQNIKEGIHLIKESNIL
jgi:hypothetical protein